MVAPFKYLLEVHLCDALSRLMGVVVVIDIDHKAAQQLAKFVCHLVLKLRQLSGFDEVGDIVVRQKRMSRCNQTFSDPGRDFGTQFFAAEGSTGGNERDGGGHNCSFKRRRWTA